MVSCNFSMRFTHRQRHAYSTHSMRFCSENLVPNDGQQSSSTVYRQLYGTCYISLIYFALYGRYHSAPDNRQLKLYAYAVGSACNISYFFCVAE